MHHHASKTSLSHCPPETGQTNAISCIGSGTCIVERAVMDHKSIKAGQAGTLAPIAGAQECCAHSQELPHPATMYSNAWELCQSTSSSTLQQLPMKFVQIKIQHQANSCISPVHLQCSCALVFVLVSYCILDAVNTVFAGCLQTLPAKGAHHAVRGQTLMAAIKNPEMPQASAATAASNAAGKLHGFSLARLLCGNCCISGCDILLAYRL